jgi:AcrR family transcriptional regulator
MHSDTGFRARILSKFFQEIFPPENANFQERRSASTRLLLLEATIDCLNEVGYARTTTMLISDRARASRGAMIHHYQSKAALIASVIDYTFFKRLETFVEGILSVSYSDKKRRTKLWKMFIENLKTREYSAYLELAIAARTDEDLRAVFIPRAKLYDRLWREELARILLQFPDRQRLYVCIDFSISALEGVLLNDRIWGEPERSATLMALVEVTTEMIRTGEIKIPTVRRTSYRPVARSSVSRVRAKSGVEAQPVAPGSLSESEPGQTAVTAQQRRPSR